MSLKILFIYPNYESIGVEILMQKAIEEGHKVSLLFYVNKDYYTGNSREVDIPTLVFGIPTEDMSFIEEAIKFYLENMPAVISVFWLTYFPETSILEYAKENKLLTEEEIENIYDGINIGNLKMFGSVRNVEDYFNYFVWMNYLPLFPPPLFPEGILM